MKNPPGLVHIATGGSAQTTSITIDGVVPVVSKCVITIQPYDANQIELHCMSRQKNNTYEDGEVQTYCGISKENYEFFKGLMEHIAAIDDGSLEYETKPGFIESVSIHNMLRFIQESRKEQHEQTPEQP